MSIEELKFSETDFTGKGITELSDYPSDDGITAAELKAKFDELSKDVVADKFNDLIDALVDTTNSASGADNIGATSISGLTGETVQTLLESLKSAIDNIEIDESEHINDTNNPHNVTKAQVGLGNVDNTSDLNKPISTSTQSALDTKVDKETGKSLIADTSISRLANTSGTNTGDETETTILTKIGYTPENVTNKSTSGSLGTSDTLYPTQKAVKTYADTKVTSNTAITGATKTKVTYDSKGLVTSGTDATTADIADSTNKRYITDAQKTVLGNTSGTNTGDQDLSGYQLTSAKNQNSGYAGLNSVGYVVKSPHYIADIKDPTGFILNGSYISDTSTLSYSQTTRTITLSPTAISYYIYLNSILNTITTTKTVQHANTSGIYFIYLDETLTLQCSTTPFEILDYVLVGVVLFNSTTEKGILLDERHGCRFGKAEHKSLHLGTGAKLLTTPTLTGYTVNGNSDTSNQWILGTTELIDEDIHHPISSNTKGVYEVWHRQTGDLMFVWNDNQTVPYMSTGGIIAYDNNGTLTAISNNNYVNYYIFVVNTKDSTKRIITVAGQKTYNTATLAQAELFSSLSLSGNFIPNEFVCCYQVTYQYNSALTTTGKAKTISIQSVFTNQRGTPVTVGGASYIPTTEKGAADGVATLDSNSELVQSLPDNSITEVKLSEELQNLINNGGITTITTSEMNDTSAYGVYKVDDESILFVSVNDDEDTIVMQYKLSNGVIYIRKSLGYSEEFEQWVWDDWKSSTFEVVSEIPSLPQDDILYMTEDFLFENYYIPNSFSRGIHLSPLMDPIEEPSFTAGSNGFYFTGDISSKGEISAAFTMSEESTGEITFTGISGSNFEISGGTDYFISNNYAVPSQSVKMYIQMDKPITDITYIYADILETVNLFLEEMESLNNISLSNARVNSIYVTDCINLENIYLNECQTQDILDIEDCLSLQDINIQYCENIFDNDSGKNTLIGWLTALNVRPQGETGYVVISTSDGESYTPSVEEQAILTAKNWIWGVRV